MKSRMSLIDESLPRRVSMAHLAIVGSHAVNGVAKLHSELVKTSLVPDFYALWPERFTNVTNGVTHRRWLACANPSLASFITRLVGPGWELTLHEFENSKQCSGSRYSTRIPGYQTHMQS